MTVPFLLLSLVLPLVAAAALGDGPVFAWIRGILYSIGYGIIMALRLLAIGFAVCMNIFLAIFGLFLVVIPIFALRYTFRGIWWVLGKFLAIPCFFYELFPSTKPERPLDAESGFKNPLKGWTGASICSTKAISDLDFSAEPKPQPAPEINQKKARKLKKRRRETKRAVSDWAAQVAAEKERRKREVAAAGYDSDSETAVIGKRIITTRMRRASF